MQKPLSDMAIFMKNIISADIPDIYSIKPMFNHIASDANIRSGVLAYRDFLYLVCDRLTADGSLYDKPLKKEKDGIISHPSFMEGYPFFNYVRSMLFSIGSHGTFTEKNASLVIRDMEPLTSVLNSGGSPSKSKIPAPKLIAVLQFLNSCGIIFDGIDLDDKKPAMANVTSLGVSYPDNPFMLIGLKVMAIAQKDLRPKPGGIYDVFLRCDYRTLSNEGIESVSVLKDFVNPLPAGVQDFVLRLHQLYVDKGLTCGLNIYLPEIIFTYFLKNKEILSLRASLESGYRFLFKAQNTQKYADIIKTFPMPLQEKIAMGYGCDRRKFGKPCVKGCHGFSFPLDESVLGISRDIEIWLDKELSCLQKK